MKTELQKLDAGEFLTCPMCGAADSFEIDVANPSAGTCHKENKTYEIAPGPRHPGLSRDERERKAVEHIAKAARAFLASYDEFDGDPACCGEDLMELVNATDVLSDFDWEV